MTIPFTQYLRPDGRKAHTEIKRSDATEAMAQEIRAQGYRFESEVLMNNMVSLTIASPHEEEGDVAIVVVPNGTEVPDGVDKLVRQMWNKLHRGKV